MPWWRWPDNLGTKTPSRCQVSRERPGLWVSTKAFLGIMQRPQARPGISGVKTTRLWPARQAASQSIGLWQTNTRERLCRGVNVRISKVAWVLTLANRIYSNQTASQALATRTKCKDLRSILIGRWGRTSIASRISWKSDKRKKLLRKNNKGTRWRKELWKQTWWILKASWPSIKSNDSSASSNSTLSEP